VKIARVSSKDTIANRQTRRHAHHNTPRSAIGGGATNCSLTYAADDGLGELRAVVGPSVARRRRLGPVVGGGVEVALVGGGGDVVGVAPVRHAGRQQVDGERVDRDELHRAGEQVEARLVAAAVARQRQRGVQVHRGTGHPAVKVIQGHPHS